MSENKPQLTEPVQAADGQAAPGSAVPRPVADGPATPGQETGIQTTESRQPSPFELNSIRGWMFDVDGCLIRTQHAGGRGGTAMPSAVELLHQLKDTGHRVVVCTNASELPPAFYADHLRTLGFPLRDEDFVTAGSATADHIHTHHPDASVLVLGGEGLAEPLKQLGSRVIDSDESREIRSNGHAQVVVVGATRNYSAKELNAAALAVDAGAAFYTTVDVPWFSGGLGKSLAASSTIAAAIAWATGREATVGGKPSAVLAESLKRQLGTAPEHTAVVGDSLVETRLARAMGARSILVLSGATAPTDLTPLRGASLPDLVLDDVAALGRHLAALPPATTSSPTHGG